MHSDECQVRPILVQIYLNACIFRIIFDDKISSFVMSKET